MRVFVWSACFALAAAAIALLTFPPSESTGDGTPLADITMPVLSATAEKGAILFDRSCASCHGAEAAGRDGVAPPLIHKIYEPSHHGDESFQIAVARGVRAHHWPFGDMPPVDGLSREDVAKIVAFVREVQRANGIN